MGVSTSKYETKKKKFFHGKLYLQVIEAKNLPNYDISWSILKKDMTDPYVNVNAEIGGEPLTSLAKTRVFYDNLNPYWGEYFQIHLCHVFDTLSFEVKDKDTIGSELVGELKIPAQDLFEEKEIKGWFPLKGSRRKNGSLCISVSFVSVMEGPLTFEVPNVISPLRTGCSVTLYQDAHTPAVPPLTDIQDKYGNSYEPPQLWVDISDALEKAEKIIYILGWSVETGISLLRNGNDEDLGSLLKRKADQGVRVLIMIWDEAMSNDFLPGLMGVHDEETESYFRGTKVHVLKASRDTESGNLMKHLYESAIFTHHQKCIIVDSWVKGKNRMSKLTVFQGGMDVCGGRWDTPEHCLYKTLDKEHKNDFYNKVNKKLNPNIGPRQPWHDVHQKIEGGRITYDIFNNFSSRWKHQAPVKDKDLALLPEDFDIDWKVCDEQQQPPPQPQEASTRNTRSRNTSSWNVQFFRSINVDSITFESHALNSISFYKGKGYDNSIQQAYIHNIRRAKHFIYIENQYFLGSSFAWKMRHPQSPHIVPLELTAKIIDAIARGTDFRVYIVIPLHSEGDPTTAVVQELLYWQHCTIQMMYSKIAKAIHKAKSNARPTDYLSFFCLTKRESPISNVTSPNRASPNRAMIYVHSKMAIFDDEYIIVGSANINERSMQGNNDTEMATGSYQPISNGNEANNEGDVRQFRLALWAEHCGIHMKEHLLPSSLKCMKSLNHIGDLNLTRYSSGDTNTSESHLMSYPFSVSQLGTLEKIDGWYCFPDTGGDIFGAISFLPNSLTA